MLKGRKFEGMAPRSLETIDLSEVYFVRFRPGEDLFKTLAAIIREKNIAKAVILSGVGSLCNVAFRDLKTGTDLPVNVDKTNLMEEYGPFELLTFEGNVIPLVGGFSNLNDGDPVMHLHCTLGTTYGTFLDGISSKQPFLPPRNCF